MRVLNVGGNSKDIPIPPHYAGWEHLLLDIDPRGKPDVVCDARLLPSLEAAQFDAVYCSHNLEHYYKHDGLRVLRGFVHILKADGFAEIRVPDLDAVMRHMIEHRVGLEDTLYTSPAGPITPRDVFYGWGLEIERSGNDFYAHKTGFTANTLADTVKGAGFATVLVLSARESFELCAFAFKSKPEHAQLARLGIPAEGW